VLAKKFVIWQEKGWMNKDLIGMLIPEEILEHFDFTGYELNGGSYIFYMVEKSDTSHIPKTILTSGKAVLDGYMNPLELQTYPIKGKEVFLHLKRRRWKIKGTKKGYSNTYNFHREGMKATKKFGDFLKEIGRG